MLDEGLAPSVCFVQDTLLLINITSMRTLSTITTNILFSIHIHSIHPLPSGTNIVITLYFFNAIILYPIISFIHNLSPILTHPYILIQLKSYTYSIHSNKHHILLSIHTLFISIIQIPPSSSIHKIYIHHYHHQSIRISSYHIEYCTSLRPFTHTLILFHTTNHYTYHFRSFYTSSIMISTKHLVSNSLYHHTITCILYIIYTHYLKLQFITFQTTTHTSQK